MTLEPAPRMTAYKERFQAGVASSQVHVEKADETGTRISLGLQPQYMYKASGDCGVSQSNTFTEVLSLVLPFIPSVGDQYALSKRDPGVTNEPTVSTPSSSSQNLVVVAPPLSAPQNSREI